MPTSQLSRPLVILAALAVASAGLVAAPAQAATPSGITRDAVLTATNGLRASYQSGGDASSATNKALRAIINRGCSVNADDGEIVAELDGIPTAAGSSADGVVAFGEIVNIVDNTYRECIVGAVASTTPGYQLAGSASLTVTSSGNIAPQTLTAPLSGDVSVTPPAIAVGYNFSGMPIFTASGAATLTTKIPAKTVKDKKTKAEKKAAAKKYAKKLKALKKSYAKALKKAGSSTSKKAAATKAYVARKKSAKASYRYAIANYRIVKKARTTQDVRPFSISLLTF